MNNKGFTLMELLAVVAVLGVMGVVVTINLMKSFDNTNQKVCDDFVTKIQDSACVLANLAMNTNNPDSDYEVTCSRSGCTLYLRDLVRNGYIEEEKDKCAKDAPINLNARINVSWNANGEMICEYMGNKVYQK